MRIFRPHGCMTNAKAGPKIARRLRYNIEKFSSLRGQRSMVVGKPRGSTSSKTANRKTVRTPRKQTRKAKAKAKNAGAGSTPRQDERERQPLSRLAGSRI
jgi:hypothetical protein